MPYAERVDLASKVDQRREYRPRPVRALAAGNLNPVDPGWAFDRESQVDSYPSVLPLGDLSVNLDLYRASVAGGAVALTGQEFDLLVLLAVRKDTIVPFAVLTRWLWQASGRTYELRLRAVTSKLRAKLSTSAFCEVRLVPGRGYGLFSREGQALNASSPG